MSKVIFQHSNFQINALCKGVLSFEIPDKDFRCRIWDYEKTKIEEFIVRGTGELFFSEEVWDITAHFNDISITQLSEAEYKIECTDSENDREDIVHEYVMQAVDFDHMMSAVIQSLKDSA